MAGLNLDTQHTPIEHVSDCKEETTSVGRTSACNDDIITHPLGIPGCWY